MEVSRLREVRAKKEKKLPDLYNWLFIACIKKYRRMIKDFYFIFIARFG
jgi:hypothetical protein